MGLGTSRTLIEQTNTLSENRTFRVHLMTAFEWLNKNHNRKTHLKTATYVGYLPGQAFFAPLFLKRNNCG